MRQPFSVHFTPTKHDYAAVLRIFLWQRRGTQISLAVLLLAFVVVLALLLTKGSPPTVFELVWLLLPPFIVVFLFLVQPARMAQRAARTPPLVSETTWEVGEAGIQILTRSGATHLQWAALDRLVKHGDYFLLLSKTDQNTFRFLPRRAFSSLDQQEAFERLVEAYLKAA